MAELKIGRETALYLIAIVFLIIGGVGLLIGVDIMAGLGGLVAIVSAFLAQSPIARKPKAPKLPPAAALVLALCASLALGACAGGQLAPEAVPYVAPVVSACPLVCDAAGDECADQAAALADESERRWASLGCAVGRSACLTGCEEAAARVGSAP